MITAIRYGLELKLVLCTDGEDLKNLNLDFLLRTPKSNEDQNPSGWSGTPPSGENFDPGLKSADSDAKLTSESEEKISIDKKVDFKQNSAIKSDSTLESLLKQSPEDFPGNFRISLPDHAFTKIDPSSSKK